MTSGISLQPSFRNSEVELSKQSPILSPELEVADEQAAKIAQLVQDISVLEGKLAQPFPTSVQENVDPAPLQKRTGYFSSLLSVFCRTNSSAVDSFKQMESQTLEESQKAYQQQREADINELVKKALELLEVKEGKNHAITILQNCHLLKSDYQRVFNQISKVVALAEKLRWPCHDAELANTSSKFMRNLNKCGSFVKAVNARFDLIGASGEEAKKVGCKYVTTKLDECGDGFTYWMGTKTVKEDESFSKSVLLRAPEFRDLSALREWKQESIGRLGTAMDMVQAIKKAALLAILEMIKDQRPNPSATSDDELLHAANLYCYEHLSFVI